MERWGVRNATISHARDVSDVVERRRREIGGITASIDPVALGAVRESVSTALSGIADLLRVGAATASKYAETSIRPPTREAKPAFLLMDLCPLHPAVLCSSL